MIKIMCGFCDHEFDRDDKRGYIPERDERDARCPYCCQMTLQGNEMWAVWNSCNGIFEVTNYRKEALDRIANSGIYSEHETVVPVRVYVEEDEDHPLRHHAEDEREAFWDRTEAPSISEGSMPREK